MSRILQRNAVFGTPWFEVIEKQVAGFEQPYYSVKLYHYVTVLAVTSKGKIPVVRQYRPVLEDYTLELPSGHIEENEAPQEAARRELHEETGFCAPSFEFLGKLCPDTGRLETSLWCYFAQEASQNTTPSEEGLELELYSPEELFHLVLTGKMANALDVATLSLALLKNKLQGFHG